MLPLYISIEGFYSYQEKQEVDFTRLTESGLFGIFGSVGSGKSSILEAIGFVLYGDTERLNKTDKRGYNMLNLQSQRAHIVFEFLNFEGKKYRFTAQWKRRSARFEETSTIERNAYEFIDQQWIPLESADCTAITNLSYANFRRTIIIPQGQFKEFLELKGKERSEMMKEIFQLNRFDLGPNVTKLQVDNNKKVENLKGALSGFETISAETLKEKEQIVALEKQNLIYIKQNFERTQTQLQQLKEAKERHLELVKKKTEIQELYEQKPRVDQQEKDLNRYEHTVNLFRDPVTTLRKLHNEKENLTLRVEQLQESKNKLLQEIDDLNVQLAGLSLDYEKLDRYRQEKDDYRTLINIKTNTEKLIKEKESLQKGEPIIIKSRADNKQVADEILQAEEQLAQMKEQRSDTTQLMDIEAWYLGKDNIQHQLDTHTKEAETLQSEIEEIRKAFQAEGLAPEHWEEQLSAKNKKFAQQLQELTEAETHLRVQIRLGDFAHNLRDGEPCPLCGALEHPSPMHSDQAHTDLEHNQAKQQTITKEIEALSQLAQKLARLSSTIESKETAWQKNKESIRQGTTALATHLGKFIWSQYSPQDKTVFGQQKALNQEIEEKIKQQENKITHLRTASQVKANELTKFEQRMQYIHQQIAIITTLIDNDEKQLRTLTGADYKDHSETELINLRQQTENKLIQVERDYKTITELLHGKKTELATISGQYQISKEQFGSLRETLASQRNLLASLLEENHYQDLNEVQTVMDKNMPIVQLRQEIQQFAVKLHVLERQIENLQLQTDQDQFSETKLAELSHLFTEQKEQYETQLSKTGGLEREFAHLTIEYAKKEKLLEEFDKISQRAENLKIMENLFRGNGFVNYISTIHMERLCEIANQRFHRLTKNQLSLTINESNEFEVIDYLNNGYKRSVKTLSGGQGFQASLCLALALAENIQSLNKADKNFFFIDEGFGTQDSESINTVFDTLQYLHQENRIVGIISHVEELKERIPRSVTVRKDAEKGSLIHKSYS